MSEELGSDCQEAHNLMYLFLDKEQLSTEERAHVKQHLDECIPCLESFEFEAEFKQVIRKKCRDEAPASLFQKIEMSIKAESQTPPSN